MLVEKENEKIRLLDAVKFGPQKTNQAYGRLPDGSNRLQGSQATPAKQNK